MPYLYIRYDESLFVAFLWEIICPYFSKYQNGTICVHAIPSPRKMGCQKASIDLTSMQDSMAKTKLGRKHVHSYTIQGTNKTVRPGDCVLMRLSDKDKPPYVACVEKLSALSKNNVNVRVRWYYWPEESIGRRRQFHSTKEHFLSDHYDVLSAHKIEGKCLVATGDRVAVDGVSESQFNHVLLHEMDKIRKACISLEENYMSPVTFVVCVLPGTVVDIKICHHSEFYFYLCSHVGIQGNLCHL